MQLLVYLPVPSPAASPNLLTHLFIDSKSINLATEPCVLMLVCIRIVCFVQEQDFVLQITTRPSSYSCESGIPYSLVITDLLQLAPFEGKYSV